MPQPPSLTPEQRAQALQKAAEARKQRADIKNRLKMGSLTLKEVLGQAEKNEVIGKMKVISVIESLPGLGKIKARKILDEAGISETRRIQGLGVKQREQLLNILAG